MAKVGTSGSTISADSDFEEIGPGEILRNSSAKSRALWSTQGVAPLTAAGARQGSNEAISDFAGEVRGPHQISVTASFPNQHSVMPALQRSSVWLYEMVVQVHAASKTPRFNSVYLILSLLGVGAVALIVMALCVRSEPDFGPRQDLPQPQPDVGCSTTMQRIRPLRSIPPTLTSCASPARGRPGSVVISRLRLPSSIFGGDAGSGINSGEVQPLCPDLVVPSGMELVFAVREVLNKERQKLSFSIVDLQGQALSHVIVNECGQDCVIQLQMLDQRPLAMVRTKQVHECSGGLPEICRPSGEVFCSVTKIEPVPGGRYVLRGMSGQRLLAFNGDFREKAINVVNSSGRLVSDTERCIVHFDNAPHYQVRVAPGVDAGLVLCGLLAIDKLEGGSLAG